MAVTSTAMTGRRRAHHARALPAGRTVFSAGLPMFLHARPPGRAKPGDARVERGRDRSQRLSKSAAPGAELPCPRRLRMIAKRPQKRGIAQPGSAEVLGTSGRRFKSCCPDQPNQEEIVEALSQFRLATIRKVTPGLPPAALATREADRLNWMRWRCNGAPRRRAEDRCSRRQSGDWPGEAAAAAF
jgi:hypothetical protein